MQVTANNQIRWAVVPVSILAFFVLLACFTGLARAARVHRLELSETLPEERMPFIIAVNQSTNHFYVSNWNAGNSSIARRVSNYEEDGQIDPLDPELTDAPSLEPGQVAVDNSGGVTQGYLYAADLGGEIIQQFDATGKATGVQITGASIPANGTAQEGGLPPVVNNGKFSVFALAVNGSGELFAIEENTGAIDVFTSTGVFVKQLAAGTVGNSTKIALDAAGHIFIANQAAPPSSPLRVSSPPEGAGLFELDAATGACVNVGCAPIDPAPISGVAVDNATGKVFTTGQINESNDDSEGKFSEYEDVTGQLLGVTHSKELHSPLGIAVDEGSGKVIVADALPDKEGTVKIFGAVEVVPDVATLAAEAVTDRSATLQGEVGAAGVAGATCAFEYVTDGEFKAHGFEKAAKATCTPEGPFSGTAMIPIQAHLEGLEGGTEYHVRLVGTNENGSNAGEDVAFKTEGPTVSVPEAVEVGESGATLKGVVNPRGAATTYLFEYASEARYEASGWTEAVELPAGGDGIGESVVGVGVHERVEGLTPGVSYRARIVAVSSGGVSAGETDGEAVLFATYGPAPSFGGCPNESLRDGGFSRLLPDCRAYEQVSPVDKGGASVQGAINSVQASLAGDRVTFYSNTGISGSGEGAQEFPTYLAGRSADGSGWSTQGLLPPASYGSRASVVGWTETLEDVYGFATQPFETGQLLLRQVGRQALAQIGSVDAASSPFALAGSSRGGAVAVLESENGGVLPGDLVGKQNVYVYDRVTGKLVVGGVLNDGVTVPSGGTMAGSYDWFIKKNTSSLGGALGEYYDQAEHAISADGTRLFFSAGGTGQLYVRMNPLGESKELGTQACLKGVKACTVRISAPEAGVGDPGTPAAFLGASADGRLAYFLDQGKLTANATGGSGYDMYRYDLQTGVLSDLTVDMKDKNGARVEGMLGLDEDGEDAYFVAAGKLNTETTQAPSGETNLYVLHGTTIKSIARLPASALSSSEQEPLDWTPGARAADGEIVTHAARVSDDGQTLLLTSYDNNGVPELYLYRYGRGIDCISCNPTGEPPLGPAGVQRIPGLGLKLRRTYPFMTRNMVDDGRRVIFDSADRLVAADENTVNDVYEWEEKGTGSCGLETVAGGCVYLISSGAKDADPTWFGDADEEGNNIFFFTTQPLVAQDRDQLVDVYDARVDGGIAAQEVMPKSVCENSGNCRGEVFTPPVFSAPATFAFQGPGNVTPAAKPMVACRKGMVRSHGMCVTKPHKAKQKKRQRRKRVGKKRIQKRGKGGRR